jgi:riboflavin kinase/FMN adenylyltransferase
MFVADVLAKRLGVVTVCCGADFRFGREGKGDVGMLEALGREHGIAVHKVEPVLWHDRVISSTWIRSLIDRGEVERAAECLGRCHRLRARVVCGAGRGRTLGFPTANLASPEGLVVPGDGIYAVRVDFDGGEFKGIMHVGPVPTFGERDQRLEVNLLDFRGELVGQTIGVHFVARLRDVMHFDSAAHLVEQMKEDERQAREILARGQDARATEATGENCAND